MLQNGLQGPSALEVTTPSPTGPAGPVGDAAHPFRIAAKQKLTNFRQPSVCDSPKLAERFIAEKRFMNDNRAVVIANPWGNGTPVMKQFAGEAWSGEPIWGKERSTWIKISFR